MLDPEKKVYSYVPHMKNNYDERNGKTKQVVSFYTNYDSVSYKYDQNPMIFRKAQVKHKCFIDLIQHFNY